MHPNTVTVHANNQLFNYPLAQTVAFIVGVIHNLSAF
jgi:hypothetical protein